MNLNKNKKQNKNKNKNQYHNLHYYQIKTMITVKIWIKSGKEEKNKYLLEINAKHS